MTRTDFVLGMLIIIGGLLVTVSNAVTAAPPCPFTLTPVGDFARIRQEASIDSKQLGMLTKGANVCATELVNGWYTLAEGGYVRSDVVRASGTVAATPTRVAPTATPLVKRILCPSACEITITVEELP